MTRSTFEREDGLDEDAWERAMERLPPPPAVPDVGRTVAAALAWRIERTPIVPLRGEVAEAATWRPVEVR